MVRQAPSVSTAPTSVGGIYADNAVFKEAPLTGPSVPGDGIKPTVAEQAPPTGGNGVSVAPPDSASPRSDVLDLNTATTHSDKDPHQHHHITPLGRGSEVAATPTTSSVAPPAPVTGMLGGGGGGGSALEEDGDTVEAGVGEVKRGGIFDVAKLLESLQQLNRTQDQLEATAEKLSSLPPPPPPLLPSSPPPLPTAPGLSASSDLVSGEDPQHSAEQWYRAGPVQRSPLYVGAVQRSPQSPVKPQYRAGPAELLYRAGGDVERSLEPVDLSLSSLMPGDATLLSDPAATTEDTPAAHLQTALVPHHSSEAGGGEVGSVMEKAGTTHTPRQGASESFPAITKRKVAFKTEVSSQEPLPEEPDSHEASLEQQGVGVAGAGVRESSHAQSKRSKVVVSSTQPKLARGATDNRTWFALSSHLT